MLWPLLPSRIIALFSSIGTAWPRSKVRGLSCVAAPDLAPRSRAHCTAPTPCPTLMVVSASEYCSRAALTGSPTTAGSFASARESIINVASATVAAMPPRIRRPPRL